jgi:hypothetical protein
MTAAQDGVHCCWPAQAWSDARKACVGVPRCPAGWESRPDLPSGAERCLQRPTLRRRSESDRACGGDRPFAYVCSLNGYLLRGRQDLTGEELDDARARYRQSGMEQCRRLGAAAGCEASGQEGDDLPRWCCKSAQ